MMSVLRAIRIFDWFKHQQRFIQRIPELYRASARTAKVGNDIGSANNVSVYAGLRARRHEADIDQSDQVSEAWHQLKENDRAEASLYGKLGISQTNHACLRFQGLGVSHRNSFPDQSHALRSLANPFPIQKGGA